MEQGAQSRDDLRSQVKITSGSDDESSSSGSSDSSDSSSTSTSEASSQPSTTASPASGDKREDLKARESQAADLARQQQEAALAYQQAMAQEQHNAAMAAYHQQLAQYQQAYNAAYGQVESQQKVRRSASNIHTDRSPRRSTMSTEAQSASSRSVMSMPRQPQGVGPYTGLERTSSKTGGDSRQSSNAHQIKQRMQLSSGGLSRSVPKHLHDPQMYMSQDQMYGVQQPVPTMAPSRSVASLATDKQARDQVVYYSPQVQRKAMQGDGAQKMASTTTLKSRESGGKLKRSMSQQQPLSKSYPMTAEQQQYAMYQQQFNAAQWGQSPPGYGQEHSWYRGPIQMQPQQQYAVHMVSEVAPTVDPFREAGDSIALKQGGSDKRLKGAMKYPSQTTGMYAMPSEPSLRQQEIAVPMAARPQDEEEEDEESESETSEESESESETEEEAVAGVEAPSQPSHHQQVPSGSQEAHMSQRAPCPQHPFQTGAVAADPQQQWQLLQQYMQQYPNAAPAIQAAYQQQMYQQQVYMVQQQQQQAAQQQMQAAAAQQQQHQAAAYPQQMLYHPQQAQQTQAAQMQVPRMAAQGAAPGTVSQQSLSEGQKKKVYFAQGQKVALEHPPARAPADARSYSRTSLSSQGDTRSMSSTTNMITPLLRPIMPLKQQTKTRMENMCLALNVVLFSVLAGVVAAFIVQQFSR